MNTRLIAAATLLLAGWAHAQPAGPVCRVPPLQLPQLAWRGHAAYQATAMTKDGRVVSVEVRALHGGVDRRSQRALVQAISQAMQQASCQPGTHVFEQRFDINLGNTPGAGRPPAASTDPDGEPVDTGPLPPHACRVDEPLLPPAVQASAWRGQASYLSRAEIRDGRLQRLSTRVLRRGVDAQVQPELMAAVRAVMTKDRKSVV